MIRTWRDGPPAVHSGTHALGTVGSALGAHAAAAGNLLASAGLLVVRELPWPIVDLRVDWSDTDPVAALGSIWDIYAPQIDAYVRRALDPARALGFGVPG